MSIMCPLRGAASRHRDQQSAGLAAVADLTAVQTELETLSRFAAGLEDHRVAVGGAAELLAGRVLDGRAAAGAGVAAGGTEALKAAGAGLQQTQEHHGELTPQARQQQPKAGVCRCRGRLAGSSLTRLASTPDAAFVTAIY